MMFLCLYLCRRFYRGLIVNLLAFSLIWSPVMQARAVLPIAVPILIEAAVILGRIFVIAATRVGPQLTASNAAAGAGLALVATAGANWTAVEGYTANAAASFHASITGGVASIASLASSVGVTSVATDLATFSWSASAGNVTASYGSTPTRDTLPSDPGDTSFPTVQRWDSQPGYLPIAANSFSTVFNSSGFRNYLCPVMDVGTNDPVKDACRLLPEMPFSVFNYSSQYQAIGLGCAQPQECAKAYVAGRLVSLSNARSAYNDDQGRSIYANIISNVSSNIGGCYDSRFAGSSTFSSYRCPITLNYTQQTYNGGGYSASNQVSENYTVDVLLQRPSFSQAQTLNDFIDRYPLAGVQPVSAASLAQIVNAMFLSAATRAGYDGINYFPITAADAGAALQPNEIVPLSSLARPYTGAGSVPGTGTGNPTAPGGSATVDLGPNPGVAAPALEGIPTAAQIMAPVFDLMPSLRNFSVPGHTSQCPPLALSVFGQDISSSKHCDLIEGQRSAFGAAALAMWTIATVIIVLGA